jgi:hypothetical protein
VAPRAWLGYTPGMRGLLIGSVLLMIYAATGFWRTPDPPGEVAGLPWLAAHVWSVLGVLAFGALAVYAARRVK